MIFNTIATSAPYHPVINGETEHYVQALNEKQELLKDIQQFYLTKRDFSFISSSFILQIKRFQM